MTEIKLSRFNISEDAVERLRALRDASTEALPEHVVRVYMMMGFCGGPQWGFMLDHYDESADECCDFDGFRVVIESGLLDAMGGIDIQLGDSDSDEEDTFLVNALDPDVQAFFEQSRNGGCGGCCGGCHGGCSGCHGGCGDDGYDDEYEDGGCCGCHGDDEYCGCHGNDEDCGQCDDGGCGQCCGCFRHNEGE